MDFRPAGFVPGQRREVPRLRQQREQQVEAAQPQAQARPETSRPQVEQEKFDLKADKGFREAKVLLRWLQQYSQDFDRIQETGKIYEWVQGSGEKYATVNPDLAEMVEEKMESLGLDDPKMAAKVLHQEMYTRGSEHVQRLRRQPGLDVASKGELETLYWDLADEQPGNRQAA